MHWGFWFKYFEKLSIISILHLGTFSFYPFYPFIPPMQKEPYLVQIFNKAEHEYWVNYPTFGNIFPLR